VACGATGGGGAVQAAADSPVGSPEILKPSYRALDNRGNAPKQRGGKGDFTKLLEGEEEAPVVQIGGEVRQVDSCSSEAPVARACWRGGEGEVVRRDWGWCPPFYTRRRAGETAQRQWAAVMPVAAINT
jgi:hypothetical protein